ncbi:MAG TPA: large conductance mechanosensitive channel protein MscL [Thermoanaerobaculia bacterium]|nr:large conductance mechanosensitive channel protein MscL [Thermoanaerobaculia bacterium]
MTKEFKEFALKGNVVDLAIGVIIGAAFGKVVSSIVDDLLMPILGVLVGKHDLSNYFITLSAGHFETLVQAKAAGAATLNYGMFVNTLVNFVIIAFAIFIAIRQINRMTQKPAEAVVPTMKDCPQCLSAIPKDAKRCRFCGELV